MLDNPVQASDHLRDVDGTVDGTDLDAHDAGAWRHAVKGSTVCRGHLHPREREETVVATGDDSGKVRSVAVAILVECQRVLGVERQVWSLNDLARCVQSLNGVDASVDDRDVHALTGVARPPEAAGTRADGCAVHRRRDIGWVVGRPGDVVRAGDSGSSNCCCCRENRDWQSPLWRRVSPADADSGVSPSPMFAHPCASFR